MAIGECMENVNLNFLLRLILFALNSIGKNIMLNKYEQKDFNLIRIIAEKGRIQDARAAGRKWVERAGSNEGAKARRNDALRALFLLGRYHPTSPEADGLVAAPRINE